MRTTLKSMKLPELVQRCRDLEARGFECVSPIKRVYNARKDFYAPTRKQDKAKYVGIKEHVIWRCVMERKEEAV